MNIGIIGAGNVGGSLGGLWAARGHRIVFGSRDPGSVKIKKLLDEGGPNVSAGTFNQALAASEAVLVSLPWDAVEQVLSDMHGWDDRILIDATNRFGPVPAGSAPSAGEQIARLAPGAKVVKAFNTLGAEQFARPRFGDVTAGMFLCGDDAAAKQVVVGLAQELGFDVIDCGPLSNAASLESLARLWVYLARSGLGRRIAFKLLRG